VFERRNEVTTITIEPAREEATSRQDTVRAAAKNDGSGIRGWILEEAAWLVTQYTRVALSVAVVRGVHHLFRIGYASESAYQRAPDLWTHGHREDDRRGGGSAHRWTTHSEESSRSAQDNRHFGPSEDQNGAESPRYVVTVEGYHFYLHRKILNPGRQFWPCPLLYVTPCEACSFLEYDRGGRPQCVALAKLRTVLDGTNAGEDLAEIRQWIRSS
jgi:hypothetical protein